MRLQSKWLENNRAVCPVGSAGRKLSIDVREGRRPREKDGGGGGGENRERDGDTLYDESQGGGGEGRLKPPTGGRESRRVPPLSPS